MYRDPFADDRAKLFCFASDKECVRKVWQNGLPSNLRADVWATSVGADDADIQVRVTVDRSVLCLSITTSRYG